MKSNFIFTVAVAFFLCVFIIPNKANAVCLINYSGSGIEQEAMDNCLRDQRAQDQRARDQLAADATHAQEVYKIKLDYFYKLDGIEKQYDAAGSSNASYAKCRLFNSDCMQSAKIPSDPTILDANVFLSLLGNKERCVAALLQCSTIRETPPLVITPTKSNDQICSEKFGQNYKWIGGTTCGCKDGYIRDSRSNCIIPPIIPSETEETLKAKEDALRLKLQIVDMEIAKQKEAVEAKQKAEVIVPPKTNDQVCKDEYGKNGLWTGKKDNDGLVCDCKVGYKFNSNSTACILAPKIADPLVVKEKKITPAVEKKQVKEIPKINLATTTGTSTSEVVATTSQAKEAQPPVQKGIFSRLLSWFQRFR